MHSMLWVQGQPCKSRSKPPLGHCHQAASLVHGLVPVSSCCCAVRACSPPRLPGLATRHLEARGHAGVEQAAHAARESATQAQALQQGARPRMAVARPSAPVRPAAAATALQTAPVSPGMDQTRLKAHRMATCHSGCLPGAVQAETPVLQT